MKHWMATFSTQFKKRNHDPGNEHRRQQRETKHEKIRMVSPRNKVYEQNNGCRSENYQQQPYPVEKMEARHPTHAE